MKRYIIFWGILCISLILCGCCSTVSGEYGPTVPIAPTVHTLSTVTQIPTPTPTFTPTPMPRSLPTGTYLKNLMNNGPGTLEIENGYDRDAVIIISTTTNPPYPLMSVYVQAEHTFTATGIGDGTYYIYYMTGTDWNSNTNRFNRDITYKRFDDEFDFYNYDWSISLNTVVGGNADTSYVNQNDFPNL